jgi:signal transduction histidine kinase
MSPIAAAFSASPPFLPHGFCIAWEPGLLLLHAISDGLIVLAYFSIPLTLLYVLVRRPLPGHNWVPVLFAAFILACGTTHLFNIVTLWEPVYWMEGWVKAVTAVISVLTAVAIWPLVPRLLALPTPTQLQQANERLREEVAVRGEAEANLRALHAQLEDIVKARTAELEQATEALQREVSERRRIDDFKDELLAMVSHELRTPLTSIGGSLHLLTSDESISAEEKRELAEIALRNTQRMIRLVNSLLDIDRIESGRIAFNCAPLSLSRLVETAVHDHQMFARQYGVQLVLSAVQEAGPVLGDADRLMQVLTNLISNAVKHAPRDSAVEIAVSTAEGRARVSVSDCGPGIPPDYRDRVFEKFVQVPRSSSHPGEGVGLGLSIARAIVERHGGRIGVETVPGERTRFYFELPPASQAPAGLSATKEPGNARLS